MLYLSKLMFERKSSLLKSLRDIMPVIFDPDPQVHIFTVGNDATLPEPTYYMKRCKYHITPAESCTARFILKLVQTSHNVKNYLQTERKHDVSLIKSKYALCSNFHIILVKLIIHMCSQNKVSMIKGRSSSLRNNYYYYYQV